MNWKNIIHTLAIVGMATVLLAPCTLGAQERPKVAVVLSGGGAKGVAHIAALKVIEEAGFPIDIVCGTSMGSLVGALYSVGYSTEFLDSLVRSQDWTALLSDRTDPSYLTLRQRQEQNTYTVIRGLADEQIQRGGVIRGRNLDLLFQRLCAGYLDSISFDSLPVRFACIATDIVTNNEVVFRSGHLVKAMRASMAIPGVFTPVRMGDMVLVDGGLRNNYPADIARQMGADVVIGVSVQDLLIRPEDLNDVGAVMGQLISINSRNKFTDNIKLSDLFIHVDVSGYSAASFTSSSIDSLLRRGDESARSLWNQLITLRRKYHIDSVSHSPATAVRTTVPTVSDDIVVNRMPRHPVASVGFRFDTEELGTLQLGIKLPLHERALIVGTLRLGRRIMAHAEATWTTRHSLLNPTVAYTFCNNDLDIYTAGLRTYNVRYRQHTVNLTPFDLHLHRYDIQAGMRWDYFDYYGQLLSVAGNSPTVSDDHYFSYYVSADLNTENNWYFPTRGNRLHVNLAYRTDNLYSYDNGIGMADISAHWRINLPLNGHLTLQPMLYGRAVLTDNIPFAFTGTIGGEWFGHAVEQQVPLVGVGHTEMAQRHIGALQLQLQFNLLKDHYILFRLASAYQADDLAQFDSDGFVLGVQGGYSINTIVGPVDARIGYSSLTRKAYLFFNIGHVF